MNFHLIKRDGSKECIKKEKIIAKLKKYCFNLDTNFININSIVTKVLEQIYDEIPQTQLNELLSNVIAHLVTHHPDYGILAARILMADLHKMTMNTFSEAMKHLFNDGMGVITKELYDFVEQNRETIDSSIKDSRDFKFDFISFKILEKTYLLKLDGKIIERPQYMFMRVALSIHINDINSALETYDHLSKKHFIHSSPTLLNAGTKKQQLASCYLLTIEKDNYDAIFDSLKQIAFIKNGSGGIGINVHCIEASKNCNYPNTLIPLLRVINNLSRYVKDARPGAIAIYLSPWHADIFDFLKMKMNSGAVELKAFDLFYGLFISNLFMHRVRNDMEWSLFCPIECPGLASVFGEPFKILYEKYEFQNKQIRRVKARDLWRLIVDAQIETGQPYMLYKDHINEKNNQANLGTIQGSNLCTEIVEFSSEEETAVCILASLVLPKFVDCENQTFNFEKFAHVVTIVTKNLNKIIDINFYPVENAENSNKNHRPIGIGIQGLADVFIKLQINFDSNEASLLNIRIFETMYYSALNASCDLAKIYGPYSSYDGSPTSQNILQYDLWNVTPTKHCDWDKLKRKIKKYGLRNSLLISQMPTANTSKIIGSNESTEPLSSLLYVRNIHCGTFLLINEYLIKDLIKLNLWDEYMRNFLIANRGSIQKCDRIPIKVKMLYKTAWELKQKTILTMSSKRAPFIDQSESLNVFFENPTYEAITSYHFTGFDLGLKTGMYYLRVKSATTPIPVTVDNNPCMC